MTKQCARCKQFKDLAEFSNEKRNTGNGGITPFSPSIDRISSEKGYTIDNIQMVCSMYNIGKSHHDELDFIAMCIAVAERNKNNEAALARLKDLRDAK